MNHASQRPGAARRRRRSPRLPGLLACGLALLACAAACRRETSGAEPRERPPNLVVILADDLGLADLGPDTPRIDRLAAEGARFDAFYAGAPVCSPSRATLFTGLFAPQTGVRQPVQSTRPGNRLREGLAFLPELLRERGYRTALVGKWHLGWEPPDLPGDRGFDEFLGFLTQSRYRVDRLLANDGMVAAEGFLTELLTDRAVELVEESAAEGAPPLFLVVAHLAPHAPLGEAAGFLADEVAARVADGLEPEEAVRRAVVAHLDAEVGRLLDALARTGLARDTLVVFASDNGAVPEAERSLRGGKWGLYEGGLRVPCVVRWPGHVPAGRALVLPAAMPDLFATLLDAAGVDVPAENGGAPLAGRSLLPALAGEEFADDERPLAWRHGADEALRRGRWKLLRARDGSSVELYDLVADPGERADLARERPELARELAAELDRLLAGT